MEKILIKPTTNEIFLKGSTEEGHADVFSYNEGDGVNSLGSLYIVGQVHPANEDTSYMINLIASLAKREYYTNPNLMPKDAFSTALKKINEVLQDFFKNKELNANIGIFSIAGENIFISKLGKFKILLARDKQNIDILNNITLFNKEHIQEKEFSNIISGKVIPNDKIFAFYPTRSLAAREKNIKANLLKLDPETFLRKFDEIKKSNNNFSCAGVHLTMSKIKEPAVVARPQPRELKNDVPQPLLNANGVERVPVATQSARKKARAKDYEENVTTQNRAPAFSDNTDSSAELKKADTPQKTDTSPLIIPSEFSSAKPENLFQKIILSMSMFRRSSFNRQIHGPGERINLKKFIAYGTPLIIIAVVGLWAVKSFILISPEEKEIKFLTQQAHEQLTQINDYIAANDISSAKNLLLGSISQYASKDVGINFEDLLDKVEGATQADITSIEQLPETLQEKVYTLSSESEKIATGTYELESNALGSDVYEKNLYILTVNKILKIVDAINGSNTVVSWLDENQPLLANPVSLAVDGDIYVLNNTGIIVKYFRGKEEQRFNSSIISSNSILLAEKGLSKLYIINKDLGRIYILDKESEQVERTLKIGNSEPLENAYVDETGTIYIVSSDSKIWQVSLR